MYNYFQLIYLSPNQSLKNGTAQSAAELKRYDFLRRILKILNSYVQCTYGTARIRMGQEER